jgi:hypothetical protein
VREMEKGRNPLWRIIAGVVALALIGGLLSFVTAFTGNPVTAFLATRAARQYVAEKYQDLDLTVGKAVYNFKMGSYMARAKSGASPDTHFAVYYRGGRVERDDYEAYVLGMHNTLQRLSDDYSALAAGIIASELGYADNTTWVMYDKGVLDEGEVIEVLTLDMEFDRGLPLETEVMIRLPETDGTLAGIAQLLEEAHRAFIKHGCVFARYGLYADNDGALVMVSGITPADIESGELVSRLEQAEREAGEAPDRGKETRDTEERAGELPEERISVFRKGKTE